MGEYRTKINEHYWIFKVVSSKKMKKHAGDKTTVGLTDIENRTVYILDTDLNSVVVAHELFHVFFSDLNLSDAGELDAHQFEEICAELFANKGDIMVRKSRKILRELIKRQGALDNE